MIKHWEWRELLNPHFPQIKFTILNINSPIIENLDFIIFDGGSDVSPHLYNETPHITTHSNEQRDKIEWQIGQLHMNNPKTKFIGICRGHQFLNVLMGGTLYQDLHSVGLEHNSFHQNIQTKKSKLSQYIQNDYIITNSYHHQAVKTLGNNLIINLRETNTGITEGLESTEEDKIRTIQCHPEFQNFEQWNNLIKYLFRIEN